MILIEEFDLYVLSHAVSLFSGDVTDGQRDALVAMLGVYIEGIEKNAEIQKFLSL